MGMPNMPDPSLQTAGPPTQPVTIQRQKDGRHAVVAADGTNLGNHNSVFSAARQIHEYYGGKSGPDNKPKVTKNAKTVHAHGDGAPKKHVARIPRP